MAGAAVQGAFEVVLVLAVGDLGAGAGGQQSLQLVPGLCLDEGVCRCRVDRAVVADLPDAVAVAMSSGSIRARGRGRP